MFDVCFDIVPFSVSCSIALRSLTNRSASVEIFARQLDAPCKRGCWHRSDLRKDSLTRCDFVSLVFLPAPDIPNANISPPEPAATGGLPRQVTEFIQTSADLDIPSALAMSSLYRGCVGPRFWHLSPPQDIYSARPKGKDGILPLSIARTCFHVSRLCFTIARQHLPQGVKRTT